MPLVQENPAERYDQQDSQAEQRQDRGRGAVEVTRTRAAAIQS